MEVVRRFTTETSGPYHGVTFEKRLAAIKEPNGKAIFEGTVLVPSFWSQTATDILASKYLRKAGVPQETVCLKNDSSCLASFLNVPDEINLRIPKEGTIFSGETDARQVFDRMAGCWTWWGIDGGYFNTHKDALIFYDEVRYMLCHQMAAPNSPQWFNTGLFWAYGIKGPAQGHYYVSPSTEVVSKAQSAYERPQPHACMPGRTMIATESGYQPLVDLENQIGSKVWDGYCWTTLKAFKKTGWKQIYKIHLSDGSYLEATGDHLVYGKKEKKRKKDFEDLLVSDLEVHDYLAKSYDEKGFGENKKVSSDLSGLLGWLIGDGYCGRSPSSTSFTWEFVMKSGEEADLIRPLVFDVWAKLNPNGHILERETQEFEDSQVMSRIRGYGQGWESIARNLEVEGQCYYARVPSYIFTSSKEVVSSFLSFLFEADGGVRKEDVNFTSTSEILARDVHRLLDQFGIGSSVYFEPDYREGRVGSWKVLIGDEKGWRKFQEKIGFQTQIKKNALKQLVEKSIPSKYKRDGVQTLRIEKIELVGYEEVFDIETESHYFVANGVRVHNCFIQSVKDDLINEGGIMDLWGKESLIFKFGSGTGTNFSRLRAMGEPLSGGGKSSGIMSFLKVGDRNAGAIKSGGITRRAAKMIIVDDDHPDILKFIAWKAEEEQKAAALVAGSFILQRFQVDIRKAALEKGGWDLEKNPLLVKVVDCAIKSGVPSSFVKKNLQAGSQGDFIRDVIVWDEGINSEIYETISGQNGNNTVRLSNEFMRALQEDKEWNLYYRTEIEVAKEEDREPQPVRVIKAKDLWEAINLSCWDCGDPGLQFDGTINEWNTCAISGSIKGSNPCSEFVFLDDSSCNLGSLNLLGFYSSVGQEFDLNAYEYAIRIWTLVLEISVYMGQYPSKEIAWNSYAFRPLGLGYSNMGALLMQLGIPYDSDISTGVIGCLTAILHMGSVKTSAELAKDTGTFKNYTENREEMQRVMRNHVRAISSDLIEGDFEGLTVKPVSLNKIHCVPSMLKRAESLGMEALKLGEQYGYKNAQFTLLAPTGTISLVMDCDTTGIEPDFAQVKSKSFSGGGQVKIVNKSIEAALRLLGYTELDINDIMIYCVGTGKLPEWAISKLGLSGRFNDFKAVFDIRQALSQDQLDLFKADELERLNIEVCGKMTVEGAPHLKEEHLAVFDCAGKCGKYGKRCLRPEAHLLVMAAAQPFLSGAISKTVNLPNEATIADIDSIHRMAYRLMLKSVAIYRDGSKLSQPLKNSFKVVVVEDPSVVEEPVGLTLVMPDGTVEVKSKTKREPLPSRRLGYTQKARIAGHTVYITTGEYLDGRLGEIFLTSSKAGAPYLGLLNCFAIAISLGRQYGVPLEEYVAAFVGTNFGPSGSVSSHPYIRNCTSVMDYIFRDLAITYLGRIDLAHIKQDLNVDVTPQDDFLAQRLLQPISWLERSGNAVIGSSETLVDGSALVSTSKKRIEYAEKAQMLGYEGIPCSDCGNWTIARSGTCLRCDSCGVTSGCS